MLRHHCFKTPPIFPQANLSLLLTNKFFKYKFRLWILQIIIIFIVIFDYDYLESTGKLQELKISLTQDVSRDVLLNDRKLLITFLQQ